MVLSLRLARQAVARVPAWAWLTLAGLVVTPWYVRYMAWVVGTCAEFIAPRH